MLNTVLNNWEKHKDIDYPPSKPILLWEDLVRCIYIGDNVAFSRLYIFPSGKTRSSSKGERLFHFASKLDVLFE